MARRINAKLVMELLGMGMSAREISRTRGIASASVKKVREAAGAAGLTWDDVRAMNEPEVYDLLFPEQARARDAVAEVDYARVHRELQRVGVNQRLLWQEYVDESGASGKAHLSYGSFCRGYAAWVSARNVTNHLEHKPGQAVEVDWSGPTMHLTDPVTGERTRVYLFVATLPYSQYSYVEGTLDMRENTWLSCHVHAFEFFGGVPARCVCDNLKTGVVSHPRDGEVVLNEAYEALGRHFMCAIMPAQPRKPKQKASVEGTVGKIATAVIARLRDREFATLAELNEAVLECVDAFNAAPFQKREGSRASVFELVESEFLSPLPAAPFEVCEWVYGRVVNLDFHVVFEKNRYSVPCRHVGSRADLRVTAGTVDVYIGGERVASHPRLPSYAQYRYQTDPSHMPEGFARQEWDDRRILAWAAEVGPSARAVVARLFEGVEVKEQAYNPALAVLNLTKRYSAEELEEACAYALARVDRPRCKFIKTVLASGAASAPRGGEEPPQGGYLRGEGYYSDKEAI